MKSAIPLVMLVLALVSCHPLERQDAESAAPSAPAVTVPAPAGAADRHPHSSFLYGRIVTDGSTYEGRLRWGAGDQEAFWGDFFNGIKRENTWASYRPGEQPSDNGARIEIFGFTIGGHRPEDLDRMFMARFGDIARVDANFATVQVTLKSGTVVLLDRFEAGDIDDGVRVWDRRAGVVDIDDRRIRAIEFLSTPALTGAPGRLYGVVRTPQGEFTGFIQWDQENGAGTDTLDGLQDAREVHLRYDSIRSIAKRSPDSALVTRLDGAEIVLSGRREAGRGHRGIYVDDARYGRVLVSWDSFERVDFTRGGSGPAYGDFRPGRALAGSVVTRDGRRLTGRLVYDLDETETTDTLDATRAGVDYAIPFALIASIVPPGREGDGAEPGRVVLSRGEQLRLERAGDLSDRNAGVLVFADERERPAYVPWTDVERIDFDTSVQQ